MRGYQDDDAVAWTDRRGAPAREHGAAPSPLRRYGLPAGFVLAAVATALVFLTDNPQYLRLAVLATAWAFVLAAVLAGRRRSDSQLAAEREARRSRQASGSTAPVRPVEPMAVARSAVLAQASAYVGAAFAGVWAGVLVRVSTELGRLQSASGDTVAAVRGVLLSLGLVAAALWLESVCRVPPTDGSDGRGPRARA